MRNILLIILFSTFLFSQQDSIKNWQYSSTVGINLNQIALSDWTQGGENSFTWSFFNNSSLNYLHTSWTVKNNFKLAFGQTKLGTAAFRTNDNELFFETVVSYLIGWKLNPYFSNTVRTIITNGYDYKQQTQPQIAAFFDPGYINQSLGFEYIPIQNFTTRLGIGLQETFSSKFTGYTDDPATTDKVEKFKIDTGIESVTEGTLTLVDNMNMNSKLRLFSKFKKIGEWDVRWDNTITAKINDYINVNLNVLLVYQIDQSRRTQIKEGLQLGFTYNLF